MTAPQPKRNRLPSGPNVSAMTEKVLFILTPIDAWRDVIGSVMLNRATPILAVLHVCRGLSSPPTGPRISSTAISRSGKACGLMLWPSPKVACQP